MRFTKMHGLGNDYLYVYGEVPENVVELTQKLSDRHFGVGSDGMIYISKSDTADFKMRIFNADGSEGKMCGNGIRCVGKYLYEKGHTDKTELEIETLSGIRQLKLNLCGGKVKNVSVDMGKYTITDSKTVEKLTFIPVNVGNLHAVTFCDDIESLDIAKLGERLENQHFNGVNIEFVKQTDKNTLRMKVYEWGSGVTMACGTGACASAAAAVHMGYCQAEAPITVMLDGGTLTVTVHQDGGITMQGGAEFVCDGETIES